MSFTFRKSLGSHHPSTNDHISKFREDALGSCTLGELPLNQGQRPGIPVIRTLHPSTLNCIIRIHQTLPLPAGEKPQPCSNSHAARGANANRDIGS